MTTLQSDPEITTATRITWAPAEKGRRFEGVWWPHSRDASTELQALIPAVDAHLGHVLTRVSINFDAWPGDQPRRLAVEDHTVQIAWFGMLDRDTVTLGQALGDRITLLVIPPDTTTAAADAATARVTDGSAVWTGDAQDALA